MKGINRYGQCSTESKTKQERFPYTYKEQKIAQNHRNNQERFYNHLRFFHNNLQNQMKRYLWHSNPILMSGLGWKWPVQKPEGIRNRPILLTSVSLYLSCISNIALSYFELFRFLVPHH